VLSGDIIEAVDGVACEGLDLKGITRLLQGDEGSSVVLALERNGSKLTVEGIRKKC
jgi:C-terminal processing protease CtpA/Prc